MHNKLTNFAIINGLGDTGNPGIIKYIANGIVPEKENNLDLKKHQILTVRSDKNFISGSVEFKLKMQSKNTGVIFVMKAQDGTSVLCGPTLTEHKFAIANQDSSGHWKSFSLAGDLVNYNINEDASIKINVEGSSIKLFVNSVLLCQTDISIKESPVEFRLCSDKDFEIFDVNLDAVKPKVFVVMQFSTEYDLLYNNVIYPITTDAGFECIRGDDFYTGTPILKDIIDSISKCAAIIADITPDNPNVFYEIGYSHAIGKPTIFLCDIKLRPSLPFDVSGFRTLFYENTIPGKTKVENDLRKYLKNL